jgi:tRNA pseudouridine55 synthase
MNEILLIDKPKDWTSFDVVAKIRNAYRDVKINAIADILTSKKVKVGHAGTLDPFATGLLIVLVGEATKKQDQYMKLDKEYIATIRLGATSTTGDPEGEITVVKSQKPTQETVVAALEAFSGEISQIPPIYSAIKVNGKRAYKLAREGKEVALEPRNVTVYELSIVDYQFPKLIIRVKCSSGTYIRTLGEDIGKKLGSGAYLTDLRRTKIGDFRIQDALSIEKTLTKIRTGN